MPPNRLGRPDFLVTCDEEKQERLLHCVDRTNGKVCGSTVVKSPLERVHRLNSPAPPARRPPTVRTCTFRF